MNLRPTKSYGPDAYRASAIPLLPKSEKGKRERIADELQPWGDYAHIDPLGRLMVDISDIQRSEAEDTEFYKDEWWGWTHQHLRFLNNKLGLKALLFLLPAMWASLIFFGGEGIIIWGIIELTHIWDFPGFIFALSLLIFPIIWLVLSVYIISGTTDWVMSKGVGFLIKPFKNALQKKADAALADGMSEFNRVTGQVKFALGKGRYFEAPFVEFDAYVERIGQRGGIFYRLMFVHRYTGKTFNKTWLSGLESTKNEILTLWDMLQRFMDVDQPIPDMPHFEPFRHLDPVTAEHDRKISRPPRYWRDLDLEAWKEQEEIKRTQTQAQYPWNRRRCKLTPKLGQIEMATYREKRPETAVPI